MLVIKRIVEGITPPFIWRFGKLLVHKRPNTITANSIHPQTHGTYECPLCNAKVERFLPIPDSFLEMKEKYPPILQRIIPETINIHAYLCPHCQGNDRDRLYSIFLSKKFEEIASLHKQITLLDIAPSPQLRDFIKSWGNIKYRSADLYMENVDDKVDMTDMHIYNDGQFDIIICSHILEHIIDDRKAISELYRILAPSGFAIVMVPINLNISKDFEDQSITSEEDRWRYFGQGDHVRIYSKQGFISKLEEAGFRLHQYDEKYFGMWEYDHFGIHPRSVLYVVTK